jgi:hypothetical protein
MARRTVTVHANVEGYAAVAARHGQQVCAFINKIIINFDGRQTVCGR